MFFLHIHIISTYAHMSSIAAPSLSTRTCVLSAVGALCSQSSIRLCSADVLSVETTFDDVLSVAIRDDAVTILADEFDADNPLDCVLNGHVASEGFGEFLVDVVVSVAVLVTVRVSFRVYIAGDLDEDGTQAAASLISSMTDDEVSVVSKRYMTIE